MMNKRCAFTLVELLVVAIIIGILVAMVAPRFFVNARLDRTKEDAAIDGVKIGAKAEYLRNGEFLGTDCPLDSLTNPPQHWTNPWGELSTWTWYCDDVLHIGWWFIGCPHFNAVQGTGRLWQYCYKDFIGTEPQHPPIVPCSAGDVILVSDGGCQN